MRHQKTRHKLSRTASHRKALLANLCKEVIQHERIKTSEAKAKAVKPELEQLITLAKRGDLHARRQALSARAATRASSSSARAARTRPRWSSSSWSEAGRSPGCARVPGSRRALPAP